MKRSIKTLGTIALMLGFALVTTPTHAQTKLTWKLKAGETLKYVVTNEMKMTMDLQGQEITNNMTTIMDMTWKVNKVNKDGSFDITQTFDRIQYDMEMPGPFKMKVKWDSASDKKPEGPLGGMILKTMKPMVGAKISMGLKANGTLQNIKMPEEMTKGLKSNPMMKGMGEMFSADGIKKMMGSAGGVFPDKPMKAGDTWNEEMKVDTPFAAITNKYQYTYKGTNSDGLAVIIPQLEMEAKPKENAQIQMDMKVKESKGKTLFDNKAGRIRNSDIQFTIESKIKAGGKTMEQKITNSSTFKLVDPKSKSEERTKSKSLQTVP